MIAGIGDATTWAANMLQGQQMAGPIDPAGFAADLRIVAGNDPAYQAAAEAAIQQYNAWVAGGGRPFYDPSAQPNYQSGAPNALNTVAPQPVYVPPAPQYNVLSPPQAPATPSYQQIANGQTINANVNTSPNGALLASATSWIEQNWILLAAGVAALVILPGMMGGRK